MRLPSSNRTRLAAAICFCALLAAAFLALPGTRALTRKTAQLLDHYLNSQSQNRQTIQGRVTYFDRERGLVFIQDRAAAWRVETAEVDDSIKTGQVLEASGVVAPGGGPLVLQSATLQGLRDSSLPDAQPISGENFFGAALANRFVSITGRVKSATAGRFGQLDVRLESGGRLIPIRIADYSHVSAAALVDASVRFEGVIDQTVDAHGDFTRSTLLLRDRLGIFITSPPRPVALSPANRPAGDSLPVLRQTVAIHRLTPREADRRYPVLLNGVVTYADPSKYFFFIQDKTGGIYVDATNANFNAMRVGQRIQMSGVSGPGLFAPVVNQPHIQVLGTAPLPEPHGQDLTRMVSGLEDSNWVEAAAIIRSVHAEKNQTVLLADANGTQFQIFLPIVVPSLGALVDARIHLRGVCATHFNWLRQLVGFRILVPSLDFIEVRTPAPSTDQVPLRAISDVGSFLPASRPGHRERIQGVITFRSTATGSAYIQDQSGAIEVQSEAVGNLRIGDRVQALGFPTPGSFGPRLDSATLRQLRHDTPILPRRTTFDDILNQGPQGAILQLDATLVERVMSDGGEVFILQTGHSAFTARLPNQNGPAAEKGSLVSVTGVCSLRSRPGYPLIPVGFTLSLRSPQDFQVLRQAPWWTARFILWVLGAVLIVSAFISIWALTLRRQVRRQTRVIQTQLDQAQHLTVQAESAAKVKTEFLANMSHEIRTPLNGILGMTELAMMEDVSPSVREYLDTAHFSGLSLLHILNDVLDLSKIEAGCITLESVAFSLEETILATAAILRPTAAHKQIDLYVSYPDAEPRWFCGDPARIRQVVLNLLGNAVKFTDHGSATIEVSCQPAREGAALVHIAVRDTGIGIPADQQARLFQNFTQADASTTRKYGGTGLGLAISRQLTLLMGGAIGLESQPGHGSTFWLEIPLPLADAPPVPDITPSFGEHSAPL